MAILDELHAVREQLLADAGGSLDALVDRLQVEEQESNRPRYNPLRTISSNGTTESAELPLENQPTQRRG